MWVQKIKAASEHFIETEKKKREKAYQGEHRLSVCVRDIVVRYMSRHTCTLKCTLSVIKGLFVETAENFTYLRRSIEPAGQSKLITKNVV